MRKTVIYGWLIDPVRIIPVIFSIQLIIWLIFMPENGNMEIGVAPKFVAFEAVAIYILLFISLWNGLILGKIYINSVQFNSKTVHHLASENTLKFYIRIAGVAILLVGIGELVSVRNVIFDAQFLKSAINGNGFVVFGAQIRNDSLKGITTLVNLFIVPTTIYGIIAFGRSYPSQLRKKYKKFLIVIGLFVLIHSILFAARMFFIYFLLIIIGILILEYRPNSIRFLKILLALILLGSSTIVIGELLRYGWQYAVSHEKQFYSFEVINTTVQYLLQAYIASDLNNAMVIFASDPSYQMVSTAQFFKMFISPFFALEFYEYGSLPLWTSKHGTVNVLGLWWFDWGWASFIIAFFIGFFLGMIYQIVIKKGTLRVSFSTLFFLIGYPGFFSISRMNYYGLSIYILPLSYLFFMYIIIYLLKPSTQLKGVKKIGY
jgi:hypothetical protein